MNIFEIKNLNISYGDNRVIKDFSMDIKKNKITSIIGPSGCGKSTLLTSLNSMLEENGGNFSGDILLDNTNLKDLEKNYVRKTVGMVFQKPIPFPFSIYENISYALKYHGIRNKKELDKLVEFNLKRVGLYQELEKRINTPAKNLSGGQQQRLSIARALAIEPQVLLLDEPCSSLDIKNTVNIENMLFELVKDYSIIVVTHNLAQAKRISDFTAFILDGELVEYGKIQDLFNNPQDSRTKDYIEGIYG